MKYILSLLIAWLSLPVSQAQILRVNGGISHTYLNLQYVFDNYLREDKYSDPLTSYAVGMELTYLDKQLYNLSSELSLLQIGGKMSATDGSQSAIFKSPEQVSISYLSINTLLNFVPLHNKTRLQIGVGPRVDIALSQDDIGKWAAGQLTRFNVGFTGVIGVYRRVGIWEYGIKASYLNRLQKVVVYEPNPNFNIIRAGADATAQSLLLQLSIGKALRN